RLPACACPRANWRLAVDLDVDGQSGSYLCAKHAALCVGVGAAGGGAGRNDRLRLFALCLSRAHAADGADPGNYRYPAAHQFAGALSQCGSLPRRTIALVHRPLLYYPSLSWLFLAVVRVAWQRFW